VRIEHAIDRPRLVSVHVIADRAGNCVSLADVEHSLGSADRALLVETPSPALAGLPKGPRKRETLHSCAVDVVREAGLFGLSAVEFVLDPLRRLFFVRVLPGLPASHALTEACGGVDLVEAELRVAAGEPLPGAMRFIQPSGHAFEARLHASHAAGSEAAVLTALQWPVMPKGALRIETELEVGKPVRVPAGRPLSRIVSHGPTRHQALLTLDRALAECITEPLATNVALLRQILADESFRAGQYDAGFLDRMPPAVTSLIPAV
jgi:acetyl-CoA carboxylase biotin carboxylase subunit/3-methylcrotonyl-CoA carboxylase alpha subunit